MSFIPLRNENDFYIHCSRTSIDVFTLFLERHENLSRLSFLPLLFKEVVTDPFYLTGKVFSTLFRLGDAIYRGKQEKVWDNATLVQLTLVQLLIPFVLIAIRILSIVSGFFNPRWALQGWRIAEGGESLTYHLWDNWIGGSSGESSKIVCEEIYPSNAIFYLGLTSIHHCLNQQSVDHLILEQDILNKFGEFMHTIYASNRDCFRKLFYYDLVIKPYHCLSKRYPSFFLSYDTRKILSDLKVHNHHSNLEEYDRKLMDYIISDLSIEEVERLFEHLFLNLQGTLTEDSLSLELVQIEENFKLLRDLFSHRFRFGRAHFAQPKNLLSISSNV